MSHVCAFSQNCQKFLSQEINGFWRKDGTGAICCSQGIKATDGGHEDEPARIDQNKIVIFGFLPSSPKIIGYSSFLMVLSFRVDRGLFI